MMMATSLKYLPTAIVKRGFLMKKTKARVSNFLVVMLFVLIAYFFTHSLLSLNRLSVSTDWLFHAARVEQLYHNIKHGTWITYIQTNYAQQTGVGSFMFYPTVFIYPWALLRFWTPPVNAYYIWVGGLYFLSFLINYFSALSIKKFDRLAAFIFSILFTLVPYKLYLSPSSFVIGEFIASTFIVLPFVGIYHILWKDKKKWWLLPLGMTLLTYSHVLSVIITLEFLIILVLYRVFTKKFNYEQLNYLLLSVIVTLILTLPITLFFLTDFIGKGIASTYLGIGILRPMNQIWDDSLANIPSSLSIGFILLIIAISGWYWSKTKLEKMTYYLGIFTLIIATSIFPWMSINKSLFTVIQLPWRYLLYASLFLSTPGALALSKLVQRRTAINQNLLLILMTFLAFVGLNGSLNSLYTSTAHTYANKQRMLKKAPINSQNTTILPSSILTNKNYHYQFAYLAPTGEADYYPEKDLKKHHFLDLIVTEQQRAYSENKEVNSIYTNTAYINKRPIIIKPLGLPNKLQYKVNLTKKSLVDLPAIAYTHSYIQVNNNYYPYKVSSRGTVQIKLNPGVYTIAVGYTPVKGYRYILISTAILWIIFLCYILGNIVRYGYQFK